MIISQLTESIKKNQGFAFNSRDLAHFAGENASELHRGERREGGSEVKQIMGWRKVCHFYGGLNGQRGDGARKGERVQRESWLDKKAIFLAWRSVSQKPSNGHSVKPGPTGVAVAGEKRHQF